MKRRVLVVSIGVVLVLSLAAVAGALIGLDPTVGSAIIIPAADPTGVGRMCTANADFGFSHDTCVVCMNKGNASHTCFCKFFDEFGLLEGFGFKNFGDCVSFFARMT